jgi:hypothetical protein
MYDSYQHNPSVGEAVRRMLWKLVESFKMKRGMVFGLIIVGALLAFEVFNYTTTDFALTDLLGDMRFLGMRWAMILSLAFCGMDFAGIARLFTPERGRGEKLEVWYLLAAWFLAATMNAILTWWGVSIVLLTHQSLGNEILGRDQLLTMVPVFVAVLVWLIRILIIGTFSLSGDRLFSQSEEALRATERAPERPGPQPYRPIVRPTPAPAATRPGERPVSAPRQAQVIGEDDNDFGFDQRPRPVADNRTGDTRRPPPVTPASRPGTAPLAPVRPAPKPSSFSPPSGGNGSGSRTPGVRGPETPNSSHSER